MSDTSSKSQPRLKDRLGALCTEMIDKGIFFSEAMEQFEKCFILEVVSRHDGNLLRAAERLKIHRNTLAKRLSRFKTARK
jgi:transcriptional regulator with PAS, ATPase and Fis domain